MLLLGFLITFATFSQVAGHIPIPKRPLGFIFEFGRTYADIQLDVFLGPLCPYSKDAFPITKKLAEYYGADTLILRVHLFPLPYHRNAFLVAKATNVIDTWSTGSKTFDWIQLVYDKLDTLTNDATFLDSEKEVLELLASYAVSLGMEHDSFITNIKDPTVETETRIEWKYTCTRGIAYTPAFMINGIIVDAEPKWTLKQWQQLIDSLLGVTNNYLMSRQVFCKRGTTHCEYIPGKIECCSQGKNCILNVGCRSTTQG